MRKSIGIRSFRAAGTLAEKLGLARDAGFAGVEIDLREDGALTLDSTAREIAEVRALADRCGVQLSGLATGLSWDTNPASPDPAVRSRAAQILAREIQAAQALGLDAVLVVPGTVRAERVAVGESVPYAVARRRATDFIRRALAQAENAHVWLCIENVWNQFLMSPLEMREFIAQFGSEWVAGECEIGPTLMTGHPERWIAMLGRTLRRVHVKRYGPIDAPDAPATEAVDWSAVLRALRQIHYDGWITAEVVPPVAAADPVPDALIFETSRALDALLERGCEMRDTGLEL